MLVSIVLPLYRQASDVEEILSSYTSSLGSLAADSQIVAVINGPNDGTASICRRLQSTHRNLHVCETDMTGWGRAVKIGLTHADGDLVCYTNAARTTAEVLTRMIAYALALEEVVVKASRRSRDSRVRRLGSLLYNLECRALFDLADFDVNGTPKVFPRTFDRLLALQSDDDLIDAEFCATCRTMGYPVVEVPITGVRRAGRSTTSLRSALRMYAGAFRLRRMLRSGA